MLGSRIPHDAPPSYAAATGSSSTSKPGASDPSHLNVPGSSSDGKNGIPSSYRRSMEDEQRPLPPGWVRAYDPSNEHQFYVNTTKDPPQSIWVHPYDNEEYMQSLPSEERERIEQESFNGGKQRPSKAEIIAAHSDDEEDGHYPSGAAGASTSTPAELPPRPHGKGKEREQKTFGRKLKDKLTGMTHEERVVDRKRQAEAEREMYEYHLRVRQAMTKAMQTGQPQLLGQDKDGKDVYVEPPAPTAGYGGYGGYGGGRYGGGGYGYSPWGGPGGPGVYSSPNARYIRPQGPYQRGGGGFGTPLALGGGLMGGMLLGGLLL